MQQGRTEDLSKTSLAETNIQPTESSPIPQTPGTPAVSQIPSSPLKDDEETTIPESPPPSTEETGKSEALAEEPTVATVNPGVESFEVEAKASLDAGRPEQKEITPRDRDTQQGLSEEKNAKTSPKQDPIEAVFSSQYPHRDTLPITELPEFVDLTHTYMESMLPNRTIIHLNWVNECLEQYAEVGQIVHKRLPNQWIDFCDKAYETLLAKGYYRTEDNPVDTSSVETDEPEIQPLQLSKHSVWKEYYQEIYSRITDQLMAVRTILSGRVGKETTLLEMGLFAAIRFIPKYGQGVEVVARAIRSINKNRTAAEIAEWAKTIPEIDQFARCLADTLVHLRHERLRTLKSEDLSFFTRIEQRLREIREKKDFSLPRKLALEDVVLILKFLVRPDCSASDALEVDLRVAQNVTTIASAFQKHLEEVAANSNLSLAARFEKEIKGFSPSTSAPKLKEIKEAKKTKIMPRALLLTSTQGHTQANAWQYVSASSLATGKKEKLEELKKKGSIQIQTDYWQERCEERLTQLSNAKQPSWQDVRILLKEMQAYKKVLGKSDIESPLWKQLSTIYFKEKTDDLCRQVLKKQISSITTKDSAQALHQEVMEMVQDLIQLEQSTAAKMQIAHYLVNVNQAIERTRKLQETVDQKAAEYKQKQARQTEWSEELTCWQEKLAEEQKNIAASNQMNEQKQTIKTTTLIDPTQTAQSTFIRSVTQAWQTGQSLETLKTFCSRHYDLWQEQRDQNSPTAGHELEALLSGLAELQDLISKPIETSEAEQNKLTDTKALYETWEKNKKEAEELYQSLFGLTSPTSTHSPIHEYKQISSEKSDTKKSDDSEEKKGTTKPSQLKLVQKIETTLGEAPCGFAVLDCQVLITDDAKVEYTSTVYPPLALLILDPSKSHHPYWRTYARLLQWHRQCKSPSVVDTPPTCVWIATPEALSLHVILASDLGYSQKNSGQASKLFSTFRQDIQNHLQASDPAGVRFSHIYGFHGLRALFSQPMPVLPSSGELTLDTLNQVLLTPLRNFCLQLGLYYEIPLSDLASPLTILDTLAKKDKDTLPKESRLSVGFVEDLLAALIWAGEKREEITKTLASGKAIPKLTDDDQRKLKQHYLCTVQALWKTCQTSDPLLVWTDKMLEDLEQANKQVDQRQKALKEAETVTDQIPKAFKLKQAKIAYDKQIDDTLDLLVSVIAHRQKFMEWEQLQQYLEALPEKSRFLYLNKLERALPDSEKELKATLRRLPDSKGRRLTQKDEKDRWEKALKVLWQPDQESEAKADEPIRLSEDVLESPKVDDLRVLSECALESPKTDEPPALPTSVLVTDKPSTPSKTKPQLWRLYLTKTGEWECKAHILRPEIVEQLFKENGEWLDRDLKYPGRHRVYPIILRKGEPPKFWVKIYPEQPALDYLVTELDRRLGIEGTPTFELVKFEHGGRTSAAVLTSAVQGDSLQKLLNENPADLQKKLSLSTFVQVLLRVLLTNPEDDKGDDYFLTKDGELIRIDNERAFCLPSILASSKKNSRKFFSGTPGTIESVSSSGFALEWCSRVLILPKGVEPGVGEHNDPYTIYLCPKSDNITAHWIENGKFISHNVNKIMPLLRLMKGKTEILSSDKNFAEITSLCGYTPIECLLVKSIIYCLDHMQTKWEKDPAIAKLVKDFLSLNPVSVTSDLLKQVDHLHSGWNKLFDKQEVEDHFNKKDPWSSLPIMCIPKGLARELISRLTTMHAALRPDSIEQMTGLELLKVTQPKLAEHYQHAHLERKDTPQKAKVENHPVNRRFNMLIGPLYKRDTVGRLQSRIPHSLAIQSSLRLENPVDAKSLPDIRDKKICCAQQELIELEKWSKAHRGRLLDDLLAQKSTAVIEWQGLPLRHQQLILKALQKRALAKEPKELKKLSPPQKKFILEAMTNIAWPQLDLQGFKDEVTDSILANLLKKSDKHLLSLNISGCTQLRGDKSLKNILRYNPNLQQLHAQHISWSTFDLTHFKHLRYLDLSYSEISTLKGKALRLHTIKLAHCNQLIQLSARKNRKPIQLFTAPQLIELNLDGCENLESLCLPDTFFNGRFGLHIASCERLTRIDFQSGTWPNIPKFIINLAQTNSVILNVWCAAELSDDERIKLADKLEQYNKSAQLKLEHSWVAPIYQQLQLLLLAEMLKTNRTLTSVNLSYNELTDIFVRDLAEALITNHTLTVLNLSGNKITNIGAQALSKMLKTNETLIHLHLSRNKITDIGVQVLAEMLKINKTLTYLDLSVNQITETGAQVLFEALKNNRNTALNTLNLDNNYIGDTGAQALADMLGTNKTLTRLILTGNRMTDIGVQALAKALEINTTLTELEPHDWSTTSQIESQASKDIKKYLARNKRLAKEKAMQPAPPEVITPTPSTHLEQKTSKVLSSVSSAVTSSDASDPISSQPLDVKESKRATEESEYTSSSPLETKALDLKGSSTARRVISDDILSKHTILGDDNCLFNAFSLGLVGLAMEDEKLKENIFTKLSQEPSKITRETWGKCLANMKKYLEKGDSKASEDIQNTLALALRQIAVENLSDERLVLNQSFCDELSNHIVKDAPSDLPRENPPSIESSDFVKYFNQLATGLKKKKPKDDATALETWEKEVKEEVSKWFQNKQAHSGFKLYRQNMKKDKVWGGGPEARALGLFFEITPIICHRAPIIQADIGSECDFGQATILYVKKDTDSKSDQKTSDPDMLSFTEQEYKALREAQLIRPEPLLNESSPSVLKFAYVTDEYLEEVKLKPPLKEKFLKVRKRHYKLPAHMMAIYNPDGNHWSTLVRIDGVFNLQREKSVKPTMLDNPLPNSPSIIPSFDISSSPSSTSCPIEDHLHPLHVPYSKEEVEISTEKQAEQILDQALIDDQIIIEAGTPVLSSGTGAMPPMRAESGVLAPALLKDKQPGTDSGIVLPGTLMLNELDSGSPEKNLSDSFAVSSVIPSSTHKPDEKITGLPTVLDILGVASIGKSEGTSESSSEPLSRGGISPDRPASSGAHTNNSTPPRTVGIGDSSAGTSYFAGSLTFFRTNKSEPHPDTVLKPGEGRICLAQPKTGDAAPQIYIETLLAQGKHKVYVYTLSAEKDGTFNYQDEEIRDSKKLTELSVTHTLSIHATTDQQNINVHVNLARQRDKTIAANLCTESGNVNWSKWHEALLTDTGIRTASTVASTPLFEMV